MTSTRAAALLFIAVATPALAQQPQQQPPAHPMATALQRQFASVSSFIVRSAEQMPEDKYAYRATADVRSFGDEIGHVADAHYFYCSRAKGEASPATAKIEGSGQSKEQLVTKLKESVAYCTAVYGSLTDATLAEAFQAGQMRNIKLAPAVNNIAHDNEHYGKIVTYLRLNGLVPPSSQPARPVSD